MRFFRVAPGLHDRVPRMRNSLSLYRKAEKELERARAANAAVKPAWAWLAAHAAAEYAIKALRLKYSLNGHERVVGRLLHDMPAGVHVPPALRDRAAILDAHYLPVRARTEHDAPRAKAPPTEEAIAIAEEILAYVREHLKLGAVGAVRSFSQRFTRSTELQPEP